MENQNTCDNCGMPTNEAYEMEDGGYVCLSCYENAVERMEAAYENAKEAEATGN